MAQVICDKCEKEYNQELQQCPSCKSVMKRVKWEKHKKWVTKNLAVVSTIKYGAEDLIPAFTNFYWNSSEEKMKYNKIAFQNQEQLENSLKALNDILNKIGWRTKIEYLKELEKKEEKDKNSDKKISELVKQYPDTIIKVLENFDPKYISEESNINLLKDLIKKFNESIFKTEEHVKLSFKELVSKLSTQDRKGMENLTKLLETNSLLELTSVSRILMSRLNTLEMFEGMAYNDATYEIKGDNSIQKSLERNMWMLNEEWWLVQANKGMTKFIGDSINKKDGKKRPDFICVSFENKLIIVDIKRPSHVINKDDIDQVENYKLIAKEYKGESYNSITCYLIGKSIPSKSRDLANERKNINLLTYNDLIEKAKKKYTEYLEELKKAREEEAQ